MGKTLSKKDFKERYVEEITFDLPIKYFFKKQNKFLELQYAKLKDYFKFYAYIQCLQYNYKNTSKDIKIVKMGYLDYIMHLAEEQSKGNVDEFIEKDGNKIYNTEFNALVKLILLFSSITKYNIKDIVPFYNYSTNKFCLGLGVKKHFIKITQDKINFNTRIIANDDEIENPKLQIPISKMKGYNVDDLVDEKTDYDIVIDNKDFDMIRQIILYMNVSGYDGMYKSEEFLKYEEMERQLKTKKDGEQTLDRLITAVSHEYPKYSREELYEIPIIRFNHMLEFSESKINTLLVKKASMSGLVSFKGDIPSYLNEPIEKYGSGMSIEEFTDKFKN